MKIGDTLTRDQVLEIAPDYVDYVEGEDKWEIVDDKFRTMKKGDKGITFNDGVYKVIKIALIDPFHISAIDGPMVRVQDNTASWRVDGNRNAWPL